MSVIFNDPFEGDEDSDILEVVRRGRNGLCKKPPICFDIKKHDCGIRPRRYPKRPKHIKYPGMPRIRTLELAIPKLRTVENNIARYHQTLEPRRVVRLVKLIHEIQEPKPKKHLWPTKKTKKLSCKRKTKLCSKETAAKEWLERQTTVTAKLVMSYINKRGRLIPNYKQLNVAMQMMKQLRLKKRKDICKRARTEIYRICEQFAILVDTKCEPYKRAVHIEPIKSAATVASADQKHCIFSLRKFADGYDSEFSSDMSEEAEVEGEFEEEEEALSEEGYGVGYRGVGVEPESTISIVEVASEIEGEDLAHQFGGFDDLLIAADQMQEVETERTGADLEGGQEGEDEFDKKLVKETEEEIEARMKKEMEEKQRRELEEEAERERMGEGGGEDVIFEKEELALMKEMIIESKMAAEAESIVGEIDQFVDQLAEELLPVPMGYESEEEEPMGIAGDEEIIYEKHPDGTSSFVAWCVYVSWLTEFGKNIEKYSNCLKTFREIVQTASPESNDTIVHILHNWADYLKEIMRVDSNMVQYFKDKPITRCVKCVDCDIYTIPKDHELPEELLQAVKTTIEWKALLQEAEKGCQMLRDKKGAVEDTSSILSGETFEILDVCDSDTSGFTVEEMPRMAYDSRPSSGAASRPSSPARKSSTAPKPSPSAAARPSSGTKK